MKKNATTDDAIRKRLTAKRDEVTALLTQTQDDRAPVVLDQTQQGRLSRIDAMQQQAMAEETRRRRQRAVQLIDAALRRVDEGEYGYCVTCGEPIEAQRLSLDPATPFCIGHAV